MNDYRIKTMILESLIAAIKADDLPKLPFSWINDVDNIYGTDFSSDKNISYYDYESYAKRNNERSCKQ